MRLKPDLLAPGGQRHGLTSKSWDIPIKMNYSILDLEKKKLFN